MEMLTGFLANHPFWSWMALGAIRTCPWRTPSAPSPR